MFEKLFKNGNPKTNEGPVVAEVMRTISKSLENLRQTTIESVLSIRDTVAKLVGEPVKDLINNAVSLMGFVIGFNPQTPLANKSS